MEGLEPGKNGQTLYIRPIFDMPGYTMMESDKELCVHRCLLCLFLRDHWGISLPVELLKSPFAGGCQSLAQVVSIHLGNSPGRG